MSKITKYILCLLCIFSLAVSAMQAHGIERVEYFFGNDPGFGKGIAASINAEGEVSIESSLAELSPDMHNLHFRVRSAGRWGRTEIKTIYNFRSGVERAEYFFDIDPGMGKGESLLTKASGDGTFIVSGENISIAGLSTGLHNLHIRVCNVDSIWSVATLMPVWVLEKLSGEVEKVEYFWDDKDPGEGLGGSVSFVRLADSVVAITDFDISTEDLVYGSHTLRLRAYADGRWSFVYNEDICKNAAP